jgi:hypothetical protein
VKYKPPQPQSYSAETAALITQLKDHIKRLEREVEVLRLYGNNDCTAQADEVLKEAKL